ncbi:MAG TPA: pilus assembly protein [Deltaproteobacteria bacterium]|nr:MAG: hypothetical protein A2Z79_02985 [Deltaproteobacteria bacterium GWA2_55_82]OGQ62249.1 MAG: hypothetical protein A3I81_04890 [Deltaproteobacteria bacterium RIFCSPLOWO2_02_FULL_55_12]OIJ74361.1 MAG: hypothetical protein A2V21_308885 [Deltaproteobacteria bacterium GWC2_55_46]HBG47005.1 pilus assembly protein [Deltaproteobacteria bacterium]HCY10935.1 pilus assembly protein [Deltaproteobacteria bacterium]
MELVIGAGFFFAAILMLQGGYLALRNRKPEVQRLRHHLGGLAPRVGGAEVDILRRKVLSEIPWLNRLLLRTIHLHGLDRLTEQANARRSPGFFLLLSAVLAVAWLFAGALLLPNAMLVMAGVAGAMPFLYLYSKKKRRMKKFERQLPEALDLISRSLKAGHAFTGGLKMVADEFSDPVGTEFEKTLNEINFGIALPEALKNLARRVDCPDLKFFIVSAVIQRETGGNLAEVLEKISHILRERFKLQGHIKVLSAEGRFSAVILIALPFFITFAISFINPKYIGVLFTDPVGKFLVASAAVLMGAGIILIRKMIAIKV